MQGTTIAQPKSRRVGATVASVLALAVAASLALGIDTTSTMFDIALRTGLVTLLCLSVAAGWRLEGVASGQGMYVLVFALFHFALFGVVGFFGYEALSSTYDGALTWLDRANTRLAVKMAALGLVGFTAAASLIAGSPASASVNSRIGAPLSSSDMGKLRRLGIAGLGVEVLGLLLWAAQIAISGGFGALSLTYGEFLATASGLSSFGSWMVGFGVALTPFGSKAVRRAGLLGFALFALVLFPLGLRGTVLFPLAALIASRSAARLRTPAWFLGLVAVSALILSAIVRAVREGNVRVARPDSVGQALLDAFAELGGSIYPTVLTMRWQEEGVPFDRFVGFFAVPIRAWERFVLGVDVPGDEDTRIFNTEIMLRDGPFGGSPVAEGYHAAGFTGVLITMTAIGVVFGVLARKQRHSVEWLGYTAATLFPLFVNVRNSFAPVPLQIMMGVVVVFVAIRVSGAEGGKSGTRRRVPAPVRQ